MTDLLNRAWRKIDSSIDCTFITRDVADGERPRIRFFLYVTLISIVFFGIFVFLNLGRISFVRITLMVLAGVCQAISLVVLKFQGNHKTAFRISVLVLLCYFLFLLRLGGPHGTRSFWMLVFPVYTFLLLGGREGLLWTTAGFLGSVYVFFDPFHILATYPYAAEIKIRFLITYALLGIVTRFFEVITYRSQEDIARTRTVQLEQAILRLNTEIEERKKAVAEVKEAKDLAEAVLDSLPGTFFIFSDQLELIRWNRNFQTASGFTVEDLRGKHCLELLDEKDREAVAEAIAESRVHGSISLEAKGLTKAGGTTPFLLNAVWRTLGDRRYLLGTGIDISDRIRAEENLRRSEGLFRLAFETSPDAVAITKIESGIFIDVNQSFLEATGFSKEEVLGKSSLDLKIWADPVARKEMIEGIAAHGVVRNIEVRMCSKQGEVVTGLFSGGTINLGEESYLLSSMRDITDIKRAEEERLRLERQVQHTQKLESLGVLAGGIAHDFNNILTSILGNADLGLMRISPMAPARKNIEEIKKGAVRAAGLANQMLAYSGKGRFELRPIDLSALVKEMAQLLDVSISKKALLTYDLAYDLPFVECDVNQVQQIVMNLITNASESLGQEAGTIRISTASLFCDRKYLDSVSEALHPGDEPLPEGVYVSLEVSDTGCGMDLETQRKVFDPFFTTKFTGRGLGLAALRGIVYGHKGAVKIYSEVGKGSTFKVLLPARPSLENNRREKSRRGDFHHVWEDGVVLVADDEATVCDIAKEMLEEIGLSVLIASDGNQAVEVFRKNSEKIVCVLLDLTMPGLDGTQVFHEMRRIKPDVNVILCSGYNEQDVTQHFLTEGLAGFIQKPYTLAELTQKLNFVFQRTRPKE